MKEENKEVLKDIGKGALVVTKVVGKGLWWFTKKAAVATEHVLVKGFDNLQDEMRTKNHQKVVYDGIIPTKRTCNLPTGRSYYTAAEIRARERRRK